jgi:murein DD-endopeptidase MepM/ murein hydrolase activator NlpD
MALGTEIVSLVTALGVTIGLQAEAPDQTRVATKPVVAVAAGWAWPLTPRPAVVHAFDPPERRWEPGHRGVDLAAAVGEQVRSPTSGEVTFAGPLAGRGVVVVTHANGLRSTLEPVDAGLAVGEAVERGEVVGRVAGTATHCEPMVCLHWGVLRGRDYLDPLAFIRRPPIVLLPLE